MNREEQILAFRIIIQWLVIIAGAVLALDTPDHLGKSVLENMNHCNIFFERLEKGKQ